MVRLIAGRGSNAIPSDPRKVAYDSEMGETVPTTPRKKSEAHVMKRGGLPVKTAMDGKRRAVWEKEGSQLRFRERKKAVHEERSKIKKGKAGHFGLKEKKLLTFYRGEKRSKGRRSSGKSKLLKEIYGAGRNENLGMES